MWGALSDKMTGLEITVVIVSTTCHIYVQFYMPAFHIVSQLSRARFLVDTYCDLKHESLKCAVREA
jgi:hypothetical protein